MKKLVILIVILGIGYLFYQHAPKTEVVSPVALDSVSEAPTIESLSENKPSETITEEQAETMKATFTTNKGVIEIELFNELAPKTVENFVSLAESNFYDGIKFHRVISGFMIQGGDPLTKDEDMSDRWGTGGPGYQFDDEIHAENNNVIGTISMANAGPNTNGSQFFINTADNDFLNTKHTVFGKVISGMDTVTAIEAVEKFPNDRPIEPVIIESISIEK